MKNTIQSCKPTHQFKIIENFKEFSGCVDYSLMKNLSSDPHAQADRLDHSPREVFSGHYVPVKPTPIANPEYVGHSETLFHELGLSQELPHEDIFRKVFSGDMTVAQSPLHPWGWATGYALSIYGTEYTAQCPFRTGNGYGDGRAISVFEGVFNGKRWEMQLKGAGRTPYCRGGDGRAVLRSSVREFLAQDFMHALGINTSRSLTLYASRSETVMRPWYSEGSTQADPDIMISNPVAITTRVASSFLRVGQLELFARRTRLQSHSRAKLELKMIVEHLIEREYKTEINQQRPLEKQILELAILFQGRLTRLIAHWLRVGYCQGNFNSDNCAAGGFTLDYGPFGFCELFDPAYQPWTGGGQHFSFFNQPQSAQINFQMFVSALRPLLPDDSPELGELEMIAQNFPQVMQRELENMWSAKLGLTTFDKQLFQSLVHLMVETKVDYTVFFRELSHLPKDIGALKKSFYTLTSAELDQKWQTWLAHWLTSVKHQNPDNDQDVSSKMKQANPKYTWREWIVAPAYQEAQKGNYSLVRELQEVLNHPYDEQSKTIENKYYQLRPKNLFKSGGISHYSCSS